jgi:hypothetical protein
MKRNKVVAIAVMVFALAATGAKLYACSWGIGYFYQVTNLRGTVVGSDFPVLRLFRWFRQSVVRPRAKLMLYEFCWPCNVLSLAPFRTVVADSEGKFDFGILRPGHYYLKIEDDTGSLSDWFQVEVRDVPNPNESEIIDISPVRPDCTGGHEIILKR